MVEKYTASFSGNILEIPEGSYEYITIELDRPADRSMSIQVKTMYFSSASANTDYVLPLDTVYFNPGDRQKTLFIQALADQQVDNFESVYLQLGLASDGIEVATSYFTVLIQNVDSNNNSQRKIQFGSTAYTAGEGDGSINLIVNLDQASNSNISFKVNTSGTSAGNGSDYNFNTSTTHTITAGQTSTNVNVTLNDDNIVEGIETVQFILSNVTGAGLGSFSTTTLSITDNDVALIPVAKFNKSSDSVLVVC